MPAPLPQAVSQRTESTEGRTAPRRASLLPLAKSSRRNPSAGSDADDPFSARRARGSAHPGCDSSAPDIIAHVVNVHHRSLRRQLVGIRKLLGQALLSLGTHDRWLVVGVGFAELHCELARCLRRERLVVFPAIVEPRHGAALAIADELRATSKNHARLLQMFWKLVDLVRTTANLETNNPAGERLFTELCALRDDFYQHLYEEECLLFPRLAARPTGGKPLGALNS